MTKGWKQESTRHALARKGIKTGRKKKPVHQLSPSKRVQLPLSKAYPSLTFKSVGKRVSVIRPVRMTQAWLRDYRNMVSDRQLVISLKKEDKKFLEKALKAEKAGKKLELEDYM